jgi:cob(I)alamin adenosyltransferase
VWQEARALLVKAEAVETARLARIAEDRKALDAAKGDLGQLRTFVQQCDANSCTVAQEARALLVKAEAVETARLARIAEDRKALDAAKGNLDQLRTFVQQCNANSCTVAQEARALLVKAEAVETARLARIAEDRKALDAAKGNFDQLRTFVQQCNTNSCTVAQEARELLVKAEAVETARLARIAEDRKALDAAKGNLDQLRTFVQQCNANSCTVAQEARELLVKAEDAERVRLARIAELAKPKPVLGFNVIVGFDMNGGDIDSPDFLIRETDAATCLAKCQATNGCIAYSFDKWIKTCYLKDKLVSLTVDPRSDTSIRKDQLSPGRINGSSHFCRYSSLAAIGEGGPPAPSSTAKACEQSCDTDQTCTAYLFRATDKQCWLLANTVGRNKGKGYENFTSGVRTEIQCK